MPQDQAQDIPFEATETGRFQPPALADILPGAVFTLRTPTPRDKRRWRRMLLEEGARKHTTEAIRAEMIVGLRAEWSPELCDRVVPTLAEYWAALDEFLLQAKDDPDLSFEYDPAIEAEVRRLEVEVQRGWRPLARMLADNAEFGGISAVAQVAIMLEDWDGIEFDGEREGKYLTYDAAEQLHEQLGLIELGGNARYPLSFMELSQACALRMFVRQSTEKNSASPSPSDTPLPNSKPAGRGQSKASRAKSQSKT